MQTISVRQANQNFSHYLSLVERGEEFMVTKRGKPVAMLVVASGAHRASDPAEHAVALGQAYRKWRDVLESFKGSGIHGSFNRAEAYDE